METILSELYKNRMGKMSNNDSNIFVNYNEDYKNAIKCKTFELFDRLTKQEKVSTDQLRFVM